MSNANEFDSYNIMRLTNRLQIPTTTYSSLIHMRCLVYTKLQKPHTTYQATTSTSPPNSAARLCSDLLKSTAQKSINSKVGKSLSGVAG